MNLENGNDNVIRQEEFGWVERTFDFLKNEPIGGGGGGKIFHVRDKITMSEYALKYVQQLHGQDDREPYVLMNLPRHKNIVTYYDSWIEIPPTDTSKYVNHQNIVASEQGMFILMEYCSGQDLRKWAHSTGVHGVRQASDHIAQQIAKALAFIHSQNILHRDIKPDNIFIIHDSSNGNIEVKLGDFGSAREINRVQMSSRPGTDAYRAPEIRIRGQHTYSDSIDVFSFGKVLYELKAGLLAKWYNAYMDWVEEMTLIENMEFNPDFARSFPEKIIVLKQMLAPNPNARLAAQDVLHFLEGDYYYRDKSINVGTIHESTRILEIEDVEIDCETFINDIKVATRLEKIVLRKIIANGTFPKLSLPNLVTFNYDYSKMYGGTDDEELEPNFENIFFFLEEGSSNSLIEQLQAYIITISRNKGIKYLTCDSIESKTFYSDVTLHKLGHLVLNSFKKVTLRRNQTQNLSSHWDDTIEILTESLVVEHSAYDHQNIVPVPLRFKFLDFTKLKILRIDQNVEKKLDVDFEMLPKTLEIFYLKCGKVSNTSNYLRNFTSLTFSSCYFENGLFVNIVGNEMLFFDCEISYYQVQYIIDRNVHDSNYKVETLFYNKIKLPLYMNVLGNGMVLGLRYLANGGPLHLHGDLQGILKRHGLSLSAENIKFTRRAPTFMVQWSCESLTREPVQELLRHRCGEIDEDEI